MPLRHSVLSFPHTGKSSRSDPSSAAVFVEDAWHGDVGDGDGQRV